MRATATGTGGRRERGDAHRGGTIHAGAPGDDHYGGRVSRFVVDINPLKKYRHFRRLWAGQVVSGLGSQLTLVAVSFQAYALTHSTLVVGLVGLVQLVPLLAGALWGGTLADAIDREEGAGPHPGRHGGRRGRTGGQRLDLPSPACGRCSSARRRTPGFRGSTGRRDGRRCPCWSTRPDVTAAIALQTTIQQLALVAGPALAGVLIATIGLSAVYGIDVATFAVALMAAVLLPALVPSGGGTPMGLRSMTEGFRHLRREKLLSATYWIDLNAMIFGMPRAVFPALGVGLFGGGAGVVGLLYAAPGAGALVGSLVTGWCSRVRHQGRAIAACVVVWGVDHHPVRRRSGAVDRTDTPGAGRRRPTWSPPCSDRRCSSEPSPTISRDGCRGHSSPWWPEDPASVMPRPGVAAAIGGPQFAVWSGGLACVVGVAVLLWRVPELWRDDGGGRPLSAEDETEAIAEVTSEMGEGEPL